MKSILKSALLTVLVTLFISFSVIQIVKSESVSKEPNAQSFQPASSAEIDPVIFSNSIPQIMTVGETYKVVLVATNTGDMKADFLVGVYFPFQTLTKYFYILSWEASTVLTLYPGESQRAEFSITAVRPHVGPLEIVGYLFSMQSNQTVLVATVSATFYEIRMAIPVEATLTILGAVAFSIFIVLVFKFLRKPETRGEFLLVLLLFLGALALRAPNLSQLSTYPDELNIWAVGCDILQNHWEWRKILMWGGYPPLFFYLSALTTYLFGSSLEAIRTVSVIFGSLTVVPVYLLGKSLYGKKAGLLSALLLLFSSFHILTSRISMTEGLMLFFLTSATYFFWIGYKKKSWKNMVVAGIFLGLSLDTKYIAGVAAVAIVLFVIWTERSWKPLLRRDFLVWFAIIFVMILPVQLLLLIKGANPYWWYLSQAFSSMSNANPGLVGRSFIELIPRGFRLQIYLNARAASPWLPWLSLYEVAIVMLFFTTLVYFAYHSLKVKREESFLMLFFIAPILFSAVNPWKGPHWLVYAVPYYFIMLSGFVVRYVGTLRIGNPSSFGVVKGLTKYSHILKIFVLLFVVIFVFSNIVVGLMNAYVDKGEFDGARSAMLYVGNRANPGDIISGWWWNYYIYYITIYNLNITFVPLDTASSEAIAKALRSETLITYSEIVLNEYVLTIIKPRFIIISRLYLDSVFNATMREILLNDYELVWIGQPQTGYFWGKAETNYQIWLVFERNNQSD